MTALAPAAVRPHRAPEPAAARGVLPAWPLQLMIVGYPVEWALGATAFGSILLALVMAVYLAVRGRVRIVPGLLPWFLLLAWVLACAVGLHSGNQAIGYVQRFGDLAAAGVAALYYVNARERIPAARVLSSFVLLWIAIVVLGIAAIRFPDVHLTTPMSHLVPASLQSNSLVQQLLHPPLAEVQHPWGATHPFDRPAAPFPYANSWGAAYAILTPVVLAYLALRPRRWKVVALVGLLVVSLWPAIQTSNRGMFLGLAIGIAYVVARLALRGRLLVAVGAVGTALAAAGYLVASGSLAAILGRQQYSDSTATRSDIYLGTFRATLESPFLGWASPQTDSAIGYPLGSQGLAWTLMYSYGFVGLGLFLVFLVGAIVRTGRAPGTASLWLHSVLVALVPVMWFYGLGTIQTIAIAVIAGVLLRARATGEVLR
ncbi:O-antigen ligase domain-containing protein [Amnibacterium sp. CER49]|uniref:O-antigen ligase domain-containing protein n=1 Tax=Amnibacterium sp. CER49 TaxID=3039161 RepID=UPI00244D574F|nr:O-antigen ligase domain-containing protein [Amnibacterium sp. CER49]MDH2443060.1 O-antigen ligase domain-containing protein [Amnibacterium sp. CER49]